MPYLTYGREGHSRLCVKQVVVPMKYNNIYCSYTSNAGKALYFRFIHLLVSNFDLSPAIYS